MNDISAYSTTTAYKPDDAPAAAAKSSGAPNGKDADATEAPRRSSSRQSLSATTRLRLALGSSVIGCRVASSQACTATAGSENHCWRSNYKQRQRPEKHGLA